jgi:hypothetical protein
MHMRLIFFYEDRLYVWFLHNFVKLVDIIFHQVTIS